LDDVVGDDHDGILAAVQARMRGDEAMKRVAEQRELSESDLSSQVLGFWLQGIRSDLTLGSTVTMAQNLQWLKVLRAGHDLPFENEMVQRMFDDISAEIEARIDSHGMRAEYAEYRQAVTALIADAFPRDSEA
jgi:6-phosphogluconate dehydrogenase